VSKMLLMWRERACINFKKGAGSGLQRSMVDTGNGARINGAGTSNVLEQPYVSEYSIFTNFSHIGDSRYKNVLACPKKNR
jgi:hypothetical protein